VIALVTASPEPVIDEAWVKPGVHVIGVGACRPNQREIDPALVARAMLVVDSRAAALRESAHVVMAIPEPPFAADHIQAELGEIVSGSRAGRESADQVTVFKSLGLACEDVASADYVFNADRSRIAISNGE